VTFFNLDENLKVFTDRIPAGSEEERQVKSFVSVFFWLRQNIQKILLPHALIGEVQGVSGAAINQHSSQQERQYQNE